MIFIDYQNGVRVSGLPKIDRLVERLSAALLATGTPGSFEQTKPNEAIYKYDSGKSLTPEAIALRIHAMVKLVLGPDTEVEYRANDDRQLIIKADGSQWTHRDASGMWYLDDKDPIGYHCE